MTGLVMMPLLAVPNASKEPPTVRPPPVLVLMIVPARSVRVAPEGTVTIPVRL